MKLFLAPVLLYMASMLWVCNPSQHGVLIQWKGVSTYTNGSPCVNCKYVVYRSTNGTNYSPYAVLPLNTTQYVDTGVVVMNNYWYKVKAKDIVSGTESAPTNTIKCTVSVNCVTQ